MRRNQKLALGLAALTLTAVGLTSLFGDNIRTLHSASADALAGHEGRTVYGYVEGHKTLRDFSENTGSERHTWRPVSGATRPAAEIERRPWAGALTAKVWCDAEAFGQWSDFVGQQRNGQEGPHASVARAWRLSTLDRVAVTVTDASGRAVVDAPVELVSRGERVLFRARTDNRGRAYLFPGLGGQGRAARGLRVVVHQGGRALSQGVRPGEELALALPTRARDPRRVGDVMLVMDTTGSMGDELRYLQSELENVIARADHQLVQQVQMRVSVNFYRDQEDDYLVRSFPFTNDLRAATHELLKQAAGGGGDFPEAVEVALEDALVNHRWSESARGRMLFLVLDAPPHRDAAKIASLHRSLQRAAALGVRIFPVAGSGIDKETEFLMRHFAVITGGSYVYLTDDSGIGGTHVEATGGRGQTERLNDLMTRLIVESLRTQGEEQRVYQARR